MIRALLLVTALPLALVACGGSGTGPVMELVGDAGAVSGGAGGTTSGTGGTTSGTGGTTSGTGGTTSGTGGTSASGKGGTPTSSYTTRFDLTEKPISENGRWHQDGLDWTAIGTANGVAYGTQSGSSGDGGYDDSYAYLSGFPANQEASGKIRLDPALNSCCQEFEILLRWSDSAHDAHGYECMVAFNGQYAEIVRWNGPYRSFDKIAATGPLTVRDGDVLKARIVGNVITLYLNDKQIASATDDTWKDGNPGIGIFHRGASSTKHGFDDFTATAL